MFSKRSKFGQFKFGSLRIGLMHSRRVNTEETCNTETGLRGNGDEGYVKIANTSDEIDTLADSGVEKKGAVKMDSENGNQDNSNTDYDGSDDEEAQSSDTGSESDSETSDDDDGDDSGGCFSSESETEEEEDLIFSACKDGDIDYVRRRVREHQAIVHVKGPKGRTPLFYACYGQKKVIVKFLLQNGAKATAKAWCSMTPLHVALRTLQCINQIKECSAVVKMLVKAGASFNVRDRHGITPLDLAFENDIARRDLKKFSLGVNEYFFVYLAVVHYRDYQYNSNSFSQSTNMPHCHIVYYPPQGKVMVSQASVCPQSASCIPVHCSALLRDGQYASHWNAFS